MTLGAETLSGRLCSSAGAGVAPPPPPPPPPWPEAPAPGVGRPSSDLCRCRWWRRSASPWTDDAGADSWPPASGLSRLHTRQKKTKKKENQKKKTRWLSTHPPSIGGRWAVPRCYLMWQFQPLSRPIFSEKTRERSSFSLLKCTKRMHAWSSCSISCTYTIGKGRKSRAVIDENPVKSGNNAELRYAPCRSGPGTAW